MSGGTAKSDSARRVEKAFAVLLLFVLPIRAFVNLGSNFATPGTILLIALAIPALFSLGRYRHVGPLTLLLTASVASVPVLTTIALNDHEVVAQDSLAMTLALVIGALTVSAMLWARGLIGLPNVAIAYSLGMITQAALNPAAWSSNAWKYAFAFPTTVLLLALIYRANRRWATIVALVSLGTFSVLNDYRSYFGFFLITGLVYLWRRNRVTILSRLQILGTFIGVATIGLAVYWGGIWLSVSGFLGYRNQVVTLAQMETGESVLLSGRSESGAAIQLFLQRPLGYGPGVVPTTRDIDIGRTGLVGEGQDPESSYVYGYLFNGGFKLHSIAADLWVNFGLGGLALAIAVAVVLVLAFGKLLSASSPAALPIFIILVALWDLAFSPIGSNINELVLALGLVIPLAASRDSKPRRWKSPGADLDSEARALKRYSIANREDDGEMSR